MIREKEVTMYDIANRLNISTATVSRALKNDPVISVKTKKKIFAVAEEMNYRTNHFASNLRNPRSATIGVIVPRLNSNFMSSVIVRIENIVNSEGYSFIISQSSGYKMEEVAARNFINHLNGSATIEATNTIILRSEIILRSSSQKNKV